MELNIDLISKTDQYEGWFYIGDDRNRYVIGQPGKSNTVIIGINPSSATPEKLDPTIRRVVNAAHQDGYDGWIMINLYPLRNKDPESMPQNPDKTLLQNNIAVIKDIMNRFPIGRVWAAWGNAIKTRPYYVEALQRIVDVAGAQWYYKGSLTKSGNPRHPLYLPDDAEFKRFAVQDYIFSFNGALL